MIFLKSYFLFFFLYFDYQGHEKTNEQKLKERSKSNFPNKAQNNIMKFKKNKYKN
jgi:hypothetical protein